MNKIVFIEEKENFTQRGFWRMVAWWCKNELRYQPEAQLIFETQTSSIWYAFKFKTMEDAMAFKLRWI